MRPFAFMVKFLSIVLMHRYICSPTFAEHLNGSEVHVLAQYHACTFLKPQPRCLEAGKSIFKQY